MPSSDASPAYRGYRLQALYTLHRLLQLTGDTRATFQPEGAEDLAIIGSDGQLQVVIQIKAFTHDLVLSDFKPQKADSFFYRIKEHLDRNPEAHVQIVTFGSIGEELSGALGGDSAMRKQVATKLSNHGLLSVEEAEALLLRLSVDRADEATLTQSVFNALMQLCTGIDPAAAFSLMTAWLYGCAEHKAKITRQELLGKINQIGKFLSECAAHAREWFTTIVPITDRSLTTEQANELGEEYFQGIAARYEHIIADLDVVRSEKLQLIAEAFDQSRVTIVHGASGQGKSTLAYRYLHEFIPEHCRYQILRIESISHALSVAAALLSHVEAVGVPLALYADVSYGDIGWEELIRRLAHHDHIRLLITMREEDWHRATISSTDVRIAEISLALEESEARELYSNLVERRQPPHLRTFDDAWAEFGGQGPLLEFVYLVTQGTALRERLRLQIQRLQDEVRRGNLTSSELDLLRLVSVAGATGARLVGLRLAQYLQLNMPSRTLQLFEQEYLLRLSTNGATIGPLHPIRSIILADLLSDSALAPLAQTASKCLSLLVEEDIERFMLGMFVNRPEIAQSLALQAVSWQPEQWVAIGGVARALLWLGVADYVEENRQVLVDALGEAGEGAIYLLDFDIAHILPGGIDAFHSALSSSMSPEGQERTAAQRARQTPTSQVFVRLTTYLSGRSHRPLLPSTEGDWLAVAEVVFWIGCLGVQWPLNEWLPESSLDNIASLLSIETLGDVVLGLFTGYGQSFVTWLQVHRVDIVDRFCSETLSTALEDDGTKVTTHFIVEMDPNATLSGTGRLRTQDARNPAHNAALQHIYLLRRLFPDREVYACQGYGHRIFPWELTVDDTTKTGISRSHLHPQWQTALNATFRGLAKWLVRPTTWDDFAQAMLHLRRTVLLSLTELEHGISQYFRQRHQVHIYGELVNEARWDQSRQLLRTAPLLPCAILDPFGLVDEISADLGRKNQDESLGMPTHKALAFREYAPFLTATREYVRSLTNFFDQAVGVLIANAMLGRLVQNKVLENEILEKVGLLGLNPIDARRLSAFNCVSALQALPSFQHEFHMRFAAFIPTDDLERLEREEQRTLAAVWESWYIFAFQPKLVVEHAAPYGHKALMGLRAKTLHRLKNELAILSRSSSAVQVQIRSERIPWDNQTGLWITLDAPALWDIYSSFERAIETIHLALKPSTDNGLNPYLHTLSWPSIVIVPLVRGKSLDDTAWRIPLATFQNADGVGGINAWNLAQQDIPAAAMTQLGISRWQLPILEHGRSWLGMVYTLSFLAARARDVAQAPRIGSIGQAVMQVCLQTIEKQISETLQATLNAETTINGQLSSIMLTDQDNPNLLDAYQRLIQLHEALVSIDSLQGQNDLTTETTSAWVTTLEQAREQALSIYLAVASSEVMRHSGEAVDKVAISPGNMRNTVRRRRHKGRRK